MEVVSPGQGADGRPPSSPLPSAVDPDVVVQHLVDLLEVTLGASAEEMRSKDGILSEFKKQETVQRCTRFASESQVALYVQKSLVTTALPNGDANGHVSPGVFHQ